MMSESFQEMMEHLLGAVPVGREEARPGLLPRGLSLNNKPTDTMENGLRMFLLYRPTLIAPDVALFSKVSGS